MIYLVGIICVVVGFVGGIFASVTVRTDLEKVHESLTNEFNLVHARLNNIMHAVGGAPFPSETSTAPSPLSPPSA